MRQLDVYMNSVLVGRLSESAPGKGYVFEYCDDYLASGMPSISVLLPRSGGRFSSDTLFPFFINMLPEGANRRMICRELNVDMDDNFGLLCRLSDADFIGAVNFKPVQ